MGTMMVAGGTVEIVCLRLAWWHGGWHGGDWHGDRHGECFFLGVVVVAKAMAIVFGGFGPSGYGVVGFDSGLILFYGFDSHRRYGCSVWWVF